MRNWMALMYWLTILTIIVGGWTWDLMLPVTNMITIITLALLFTTASVIRIKN